MRMSVRAAVPAALPAVAVFVSGCGDSSDGERAGGETTQPAVTSVATTAAKSPQQGGSITVGQFSPLAGFDPVNSRGAATSRGAWGDEPCRAPIGHDHVDDTVRRRETSRRALPA